MTRPGQHAVRLSETVSTNRDALRLALAGENLPLWVTAETQTGGRGRSGRIWVSQPGNLHASVAIRSAAPLPQAAELALVAGIALYDAVQSLSPLAKNVALRLKWPNDVLIGTAKAGGILVESTSALGEPGFLAAIGFGLNIVSAPGDLGRAVTALGQHIAGASADAVLDGLMITTERTLGVWDEGRGFGRVREAWLMRAGPLGEAISINTIEGRVTGAFAGLTKTGALLIDCGGTLRDFSYGDVALVTDAATDRPV